MVIFVRQNQVCVMRPAAIVAFVRDLPAAAGQKSSPRFEALGRGRGSGEDGFLGFRGLLADVVGDVGQVAFVGTNGREIFGLADQVECAESFPDLVGPGIDDGNLGAGSDVGPGLRDRPDAAGNRGADFRRLPGIRWRQFGDESALMDGSPGAVGIDDAAGRWRTDVGWFEKRNNLQAARGVSEADQ